MSARTVSALIVDDEALGRDVVRHMLGSHADIHLVGECSDGEKALAMIRRLRPDLVFLDVQMPRLDGVGMLQQLVPAERPLIVFITAHDAYAIKAFEAQALDYLLKPFDQERFDDMLARVRRRLAELHEARLGHNLRRLLAEHTAGSVGPASSVASPAGRAPFDERIVVKESGRVLLIGVADVDWFEAAGNYVALHVAGRSHLVHATMAAVEARLNPDKFVRLHRSTIVNVDRIKELRPHFNGEYMVLLKDGTRLKLSRGYLERAKNALGLP